MWGDKEQIKFKRGDMIKCDGVNDWLWCLKCKHISTTECPIEREDVIEILALQLKIAEKEKEKRQKTFRKWGSS